MGYSFDSCGRLSCDNCGAAEGTTRKRRCPSGYCPSWALCPTCWKTVRQAGTWKDGHKHCAAAHARYVSHDANRRELLTRGLYLRNSAMLHRDGHLTRVLFANAQGHTVGFDMAPATYQAIPMLTHATPDDYRAHGILTEAPNGYADIYAQRVA